MDQKTIKWGILGTSSISQHMAAAIAESRNGQVIAVAGRDADKSQAFAKEFSISKPYNHYADLLTDPEIDAVYIGLPNHLHKEWAVKSLEAGKHVLCEKPLALNEEETLDIMATAQIKGLVCMEAIMYRCHPLIQEIKSILQQNLIGHVQLFQAVYTAKIAHLANPVAGGAIFNLGCYPLSLIRYLSTANVVNLKTIGIENANHSHNDTRSSAILSFDDQSLATITVSDDLDMSWQFAIWGTKGRLEMLSNPWFPNNGEQVFRVYRSNEQRPQEIKLTSPLSAYTYQINTMNTLVIEPSAKLLERVTLQESLENVRLLDKWRTQALSLAKEEVDYCS
ncbi:oxidoreductase [Legionella quinlivanii]|uniref:Oxidoreductase n=1 Tax=Legionella quinlivanii TaxID=45073 RepID=A0A0W0Y6C6_9GAMM|nr:Gfo/Idh/MocA family oxidoreductase [Legionella quinlivanii]KTD52507.1 oxidoreductase [Legionella quinlivanii]SEG23931.1 Predicted dehydrogenase [Legionella quinlivanii DSM 21216]STY09914.1 oxidoreductase [Legionella quinlivanii]